LRRSFLQQPQKCSCFTPPIWEQHLPPAYFFAQGSGAARDIMVARDRILQDAEAHVDRAADRLRSAGFIVRTEVQPEGDASSAILDAAAKWPADVILVGSHGRSGLNRFLLGSVSDRVVRHAPCSVQVVRTGARSRATG
jgi:nucleotide-binding universal stress UspA family protein